MMNIALQQTTALPNMIEINDISDLKGKNVAVFGLGKAGRAAIDFLLDVGCLVYAWDDNEEACKQVATEIIGKDVTLAPPDTYMWGCIDILILSPGIPFTHPKPHEIVTQAFAADCKVMCEVELLYYANKQAKFVGITGTNGKSTTTALVGHILKHAGMKIEVGGNIGTPACALAKLGFDGVYILELSSYQLDLLWATKLDIAVLLNITPDHLDRHGDMANYIRAKKAIFNHQTSDDIKIIGVDDKDSKAIYEYCNSSSFAQTFPISSKNSAEGGVSVANGKLIDEMEFAEHYEFELGELKKLSGQHNAQNIAAAYAVARGLDVDREIIIEAIKSFEGLEYRMQYIGMIENILFYNDSKATNAEATSHALSSFENIYWIAGGVEKEGGINSLGECFLNIRHAFLIGEAKDNFAVTLGGKVEYSCYDSLKDAEIAAFNMALSDLGKIKNPVVLLSPACASFDMYKSFEERGQAFCDIYSEMKMDSVKRICGG